MAPPESKKEGARIPCLAEEGGGRGEEGGAVSAPLCSSGSEESEDRIQTILAVIWKLLGATVRCWGSWRWAAGTRLQVFLKVGLLGSPGGLNEGWRRESDQGGSQGF